MPDLRSHVTIEDREARRALLHDALGDLVGSSDPQDAATDVMRALDSYMDARPDAQLPEPREPPVTDFDHRAKVEVRWITWVIVGGAILGTLVAGVLLAGWPAALAIVGIRAAALAILVSGGV